jgi:hypothetical protein
LATALEQDQDTRLKLVPLLLSTEAEASVSELAALAWDEHQERSMRLLLLDEGSPATNEQRRGVTVGRNTYPARSTLDPLQGRRRSMVLVARNRLQRSTFRPLPRSATGTIVQSLSDDAVALTD